MDQTAALEAIIQYVAALGLGGVVTLLVQIAKRLGWVPDGYGGTVATILNVVIFLILLVIGALGIDVEGEGAREIFGVIANVAQLLLLILSSLGTFNTLRAANVVGFRKSIAPQIIGATSDRDRRRY